MSAPVDSLSIKVDASARGANQQLDKLVQKMIQLRSSVNGINVGNLNTMATSIQNFSKAASGLNQVKTSDFTRMAKSIEKLSNIRKGELNRAATAITNISKAFSGIGNVSDGANKIAQLAHGISRLGYKSTTQAIQNIPLLTKELKNMMSELSKAPTVSNNIIAMTNAMANLGAQASGIRSLGSAMNSAGTRGNGFFGTMKNVLSSIKNFSSNVRSVTSHNRSFASTIGLLYAKLFILKRAFDAFGSAVKSSMDYIEEYNYFNVTMEKIASEWSEDFKKYGYENADAYGKSFQGRLTQIMNKMTGFQMNDDGTLTDSGNKNLGLDVTQMTNYSAGVAQVTNSVGLTGEASVVTSKALSMLAGDMSSFRNLDMSTVMNNFSSGLIGQSRALYKYGIDITNATLATYAHETGIKKDIAAMTQGEKMQLRMIAILDQSKVAWGDLAKTINSPSNQLRLLQNNFKALSRTIGNMFLPVVTKVLPYVNALVIAIRRLFEWTASMLGIDLKDVIGNSGGGYSDMFDGIEDDADSASDAVDNTTDSVKKLTKQLMGFDELNVITTNQGSSNNSGGDGYGGSSAPIDLTDKLSSALADYEKVWNDEYDKMTNDAQKFADKLTKLFKDAWTSGDGTDIGTSIASWLNKGIDWVNNNGGQFADGLKKIAGILGTSLNGFVSEFDWSGLGTAVGNSIKAALEAEEKFFDTVNWVNLGKGLAKSLNSAIDSGAIQQYFKTMASKIKSAIETAFGFVTTFDFPGLGEAVGQGINDFFNKMGEVNDKTGLNGWQELGQTISESIKGIATSMTTALETVEWENVGQAIADFIGSIDWNGIVWNLKKLLSSFIKAFKKLLKGAGMSESMADVTISVAIGGWVIKNVAKTKLGQAITKKIGNKFKTTLKNVSASIKNWFVDKWNESKLKTILEDKIQGIKTKISDAAVSVKNWVIDKINKTSLSTKMSEKIGTVKANVPVLLEIAALTIAWEGFENLSDWLATKLDEEIEAVPDDFFKKHSFKKFEWDLGLSIPKDFLKSLFTDQDFEDEQEWLNNHTLSVKVKALFSDWHDDITNWWNGVVAWWGEKFVTIKASVEEAVSGAIDALKEKWDSIHSKTSVLAAEVRDKVKGGIENLKKAWNSIKNGTATKTLKQAGKNVIQSAKNVWDGIKNSSVVKTLKQTGESVLNRVKKTWDSFKSKVIKLDVVTDLVKGAIKQVVEWINKYIIGSLNKLHFNVAGEKIGINIKEIPTPRFASGGFPQQGQYFLARENGPELVGTIGGKTAVANNNQIVQSVSDGVFNALAPVLTQVVNSVNSLNERISMLGDNDVCVEVDGDNILRVVKKSNIKYKKQYGKSALT